MFDRETYKILIRVDSIPLPYGGRKRMDKKTESGRWRGVVRGRSSDRIPYGMPDYTQCQCDSGFVPPLLRSSMHICNYVFSLAITAPQHKAYIK